MDMQRESANAMLHQSCLIETRTLNHHVTLALLSTVSPAFLAVLSASTSNVFTRFNALFE
jgi:hypothetical protein